MRQTLLLLFGNGRIKEEDALSNGAMKIPPSPLEGHALHWSPRECGQNATREKMVKN